MPKKEWLMDKTLLVIERFLYHRAKTGSDNPVISEFAEKMCEIDIWEMWALTQDLC